MQRCSATREPPLHMSSSPPMAPLLLIAAMASPPMTVRVSPSLSVPTALPRTPPPPSPPRPSIAHRAPPLHALKVYRMESQRHSISTRRICSPVPMLLLGFTAEAEPESLNIVELIIKPKDDRYHGPRRRNGAPLYAAPPRQGIQEAK
jgi:hypothetical protein